MVIQSLFEEPLTMELEFGGLKYMRLEPQNEAYTCEILDSSIFMNDGYIYWCNSGGVTVNNIKNCGGTVICASKLRWRFIRENINTGESENQ